MNPIALLLAALAAATYTREIQAQPPGASVIPPGFSLVSPMVQTDGRFDGQLGAMVARNLGQGDRVTVVDAFATNRIELVRDAAPRWLTNIGLPATNTLEPGHGFIVNHLGTTTVSIAWTGNPPPPGAATCDIHEGENIIGLAITAPVGVEVPFALPVAGETVSSFDEEKADQLQFLDADGSWHRLVRVPEGKWIDMKTGAVATNSFVPGQACFYVRQPGAGSLSVRF